MPDLGQFLIQDLPVLAAGVLTAIACAVLGCFLVLRRMSLLGDAISHAVLPGIVAAFLLTHSLQALPVFIGAALVGVLTALLTEIVHRFGKVEPGAALGVVFTFLFAIGVIMLEQVGGRSVHLDADCVLYGAMEGVIWPTAPQTGAEWFTAETWSTFPRQVTTLFIVALLDVMFVVVMFKELRITSFDPALAASQGIHPARVHYLLMTFTAITTVAAFEAVGSILVVAMLIVPAVVAHLLTDRLWLMLPLSAVVGASCAVLGYVGARGAAVSSAAMMGVTLGGAVALAAFLAPTHGILSRSIRRLRLSVSIHREDMLGLLFRIAEQAPGTAALPAPTLRQAVGGGIASRLALIRIQRRGEAQRRADTIVLTDKGRMLASTLVRSHRLWESFLVEHLGLRPDHVHSTATQLEHVTDPLLQDELARRVEPASTDPHGRSIPPPS